MIKLCLFILNIIGKPESLVVPIGRSKVCDACHSMAFTKQWTCTRRKHNPGIRLRARLQSSRHQKLSCISSKWFPSKEIPIMKTLVTSSSHLSGFPVHRASFPLLHLSPALRSGLQARLFVHGCGK